MNKKLLIIGSALLFSTGVFAQQRTCGTPVPGPELEVWMQKGIEKMKSDPSRQSVVYTIPVIVHVIHNGENVGTGSNISDAQVQSQIDVLNEDYRRTNADASNTPSVFAGVAADCEINFCLATKDENGVTLATPGIDRINRNTEGWTTPPYNTSFIDGTIKPATIWDVNKYLNIWVVSMSGGILGYATFPLGSGISNPTGPYGSTSTDGVVIGYTYFGRVGNLDQTFNKGRTATHEVGHWLGLRHIWGDASCGTDHVTDTPTQQQENYDCPTFPQVTCSNGPNGDMFMNYMDYVDDNCMNMFTAGQKARMQTTMTSGTYRINYNSSVQCAPPVVLSLDAGITNVIAPTGSSCNSTISPTVTLKNFGSTTLTSAAIKYKIDNGTPATYNWTGSLASNATANVNLPAIASSNGAHTFRAYPTSPNGGTDGSASNDTSSSTYTTMLTGQALPFSEGFESTSFPPASWSLTNPDNKDTWARTTTAKKSGSASALMNNYNYNASGEKDDINTPMLDLTVTNPTLTFQVAYKMYTNPSSTPNYSDTLQVLVSTDCGLTWSSVYKKFGTTLATGTPAYIASAFNPGTTNWRLETISLNSFASESSVIVKFRNITDYENMLYIDDINISSSVGIEQVQFENSVVVYPNPAKDQLFITHGLNGQEVSVKMFNTLGEVVWKADKSTSTLLTVDLSDKADGFYMLEITSGNTKTTKKVVVNH